MYVKNINIVNYSYAGNEADSDEDVSKPNYNVVGLEQSSSDNETDDEEADSEPVEPTKPELPLPSTENDSDTIKDEDDEKPPPAPVAPITPTKPKLPIRPTKYVHVSRSKEIQAARIKLPILSEEQVIMEAINENLIVILAGETGSGKTTQVPQFLYEAGYAEDGKLIGITEPRRVAAISMAKRVAHEMNLSSDIVSYLIRFEGNVTNQTRIKFMTDGVLLKEIETDFVLSRYSVIILDEAHERSIYTDILVGLLSRIVLLRHKRGEPLKLIIMSATLRVEDFTKNTRLFKIPPPVLKVEARQFPVTIHFNKRTGTEYVKDAYKKALKIHNQLPEGGILIFLTGQQEVNFVVRKLRKAFPFKGRHELAAKKEPIKATFDDAGDSDDSCEMDMKKAISNARRSAKKRRAELVLPQISLDDYKLPTDDTEADLVDQESIDSDADEYNFGSDDDDDDDENVTGLKSTQPLWVLPLYSLLSSEKQAKVFEAPPANTRLCVVTTNVAETSLTIPNIKYVVDSGRQKARLYDKITGVSSFVVSFCSKAAANQRAGRAGRTAPGHCYRLYSSAVYNDEFEDFAVPDIQSKPVDHLMLQMKCMGIDKVINFPFPSPPDLVQLQVAEQNLKLLGALEVATVSSTNSTKSSEELTKVTALGQAIAAFPVSPRFGKMLALSHQHNLLQYTVCMVAALSVQEVLLETPASDPADSAALHQKSKWTHKRRAWAGTGNSLLLGDPMILLRAVGASEYAGSMGKLDEFCTENGLRPKAVAEIRKLRVQLTNDISLSMPDVVNLSVDPQMPPPSDVQAKLLRQILLAGMGDHIARRIPPEELNDKEDKIKFRYAYRCPDMVDPVFMHAASVLKKSQPDWVLYQEVYELQNGDSRKMFMRGVTAIEPEWLVTYVPSLCNVRAIKEEPLPPRLNQKDGRIYCYVDATFGRSGWEVPLAQIEMPFGELACR